MNKHFIAGNVGNDPEIKKLESGMTIAKISVAVNEYQKADHGESNEKTTWFKVVAFGKLAETVEKYVKKGKKVLVVGRVSINEYLDESGTRRFFTETIANEIEFMSSPKQEETVQPAEIDPPF